MLATLALAALATPDLLDVHPLLGPYHEIQDAVLAAADGDTIRVAPGDYSSFAIRGKSLAVVAPDGARVVGGPVRIQELGPGQWAVLDNFRLRTIAAQEDAPLIIGLNQGAVRCSRVQAGGQYWTSTSGVPMGAVVRVLSSSDVVLTDCEFRGGFQGGLPEPVLSPLVVQDATLTLIGGQVWPLNSVIPASATAVFAANAVLELHGTHVVGGHGTSNGPDPNGIGCLGLARPGGTGIDAHDTIIREFGAAVFGGAGGIDNCYLGPYDPSFAPSVASGEAYVLSGTSAVVAETPTPLLLKAPPLVTEGTAFTVQASAFPTDVVLLVSGTRAMRRPLPGYLGALLIGGAVGEVQRRIIGIGSSSASVTAPALPDFATAELHLQAVAMRQDSAAPSGRVVVFGGPRTVIALDSAY